jgi:uncharacterized protein YqfA (UPF0365 family)
MGWLLAFPTMLVVMGAPAWIPVLRWRRRARALGVAHPVRHTLGMRLRRVRPGDVYLPLERAQRAGVHLDAQRAEAHLLAGGHLDRVVDALVLAAAKNVRLDFQEATALDLAGRDPLQIVRDGLVTAEGRIDYAAVFPHWK